MMNYLWSGMILLGVLWAAVGGRLDEVIDKKTLSIHKAHQIARHLLFPVASHMQMVFTDVLTTPCFMVSGTVKDVIRKYDPFIFFVRVILLDQERKKSMAYYIPYLNRIGYASRKDADKENGKCLMVNKESVKEKIILEITDGNHSYVIMRMDLVESILRRQATGIGLREVQIG